MKRLVYFIFGSIVSLSFMASPLSAHHSHPSKKNSVHSKKVRHSHNTRHGTDKFSPHQEALAIHEPIVVSFQSRPHGIGAFNKEVPSPNQDLIPEEKKRAIQDAVDRYKEQFQIPGIQVSVCVPVKDKSGKTVSFQPFFFTQGTLSRQSLIPVDAKTQFNCGQIFSIWMTQIALQLVSEGKINLDNSVGVYCPSLDFSPDLAALSIRDVLQRSTGGLLPLVPPDIYFDISSCKTLHLSPYLFQAFNEPKKSWNANMLIHEAHNITIPLQRSISLHLAFDNAPMTNYLLLEEVLTFVTGKTIEQLVQERILGPLDIKSTICDQTFQQRDDEGNPTLQNFACGDCFWRGAPYTICNAQDMSSFEYKICNSWRNRTTEDGPISSFWEKVNNSYFRDGNVVSTAYDMTRWMRRFVVGKLKGVKLDLYRQNLIAVPYFSHTSDSKPSTIRRHQPLPASSPDLGFAFGLFRMGLPSLLNWYNHFNKESWWQEYAGPSHGFVWHACGWGVTGMASGYYYEDEDLVVTIAASSNTAGDVSDDNCDLIMPHKILFTQILNALHPRGIVVPPDPDNTLQYPTVFHPAAP